MLLAERIETIPSKIICWVLMITLNTLTMSVAWAEANSARTQSDYDARIQQTNTFGTNLFNQVPDIQDTITPEGEIIVNGEVVFDQQSATGQQEGDYIPGNTDTYGDDSATIISGQTAQETYESKEPETSSERAYDILNKSFQTMKPDLSNDPIWDNTDHVFDNIKEIAEDFAECSISTQLVTTGSVIHVPDYKQCERIPVITDTITVGHSYDVGIVKHESGPLNLTSCGTGCLDMWIGTIGNNYWSGHGTVFEEAMSIRVIQPDAIRSVTLNRVKYDDYFQVYLNHQKVYQGPSGYSFPENTPAYDYGGTDLSIAIDVTNSFTEVEENSIIDLKTRTSVVDRGEGYAKIRINYDPSTLVYNELWNDAEKVEKTNQIIDQINDGFCTGSVACTNMPTLNASGCAEINGIYVCESDFLNGSPIAGINPFCKTVVATSDCGFNEGEICTTNMEGVETCFQNETVETNSCRVYEQDPTCSFIKSECVEDSSGESGHCYAQEDTFDCGFDADNTTETAEQVLTCDGVLQCVGESCYSANKDGGNSSFSEVVALMQVLTFASTDMTCTGIGEMGYNEEEPNDSYTPTYICEDGYEWDGVAEKCIKDRECSYDADNYYAAGLRNGSQVYFQGQEIANDKSSYYCKNNYKDGYLFTCGELQEKVETDNYYESCVSTYKESEEFGCPTATHEIKNGACVVKPTPECKPDFALIEGDDIWSSEDDYCLFLAEPDPICPSGSGWNGSRCIATSTVGFSYSCPSGYTKSGSQCIKSTYQCIYNGSNYWMGWATYGESGQVIRLNGRDYSYKSGGGSHVIGGVSYTPGAKMKKDSYSSKSQLCWGGTSTTDQTKYCPSGYSSNGSQCYKTTSSLPSSYSCDGIENYNSATGKCEIIEEATVACPDNFPNWNEEEGRCMKNWVGYNQESPASKMFNENSSEENAKPQHPKNLAKEIIALALSPVKIALEVIFTPAIASEVHPEDVEQVGVTQETMSVYIASKLSSAANIAKTNEELLGITEQGFSSARMVNARAASTHEGDYGSENVQCELFQGTASECKIAVGGMQNCCESPVPTTLSDYITLTMTSIQLANGIAAMTTATTVAATGATATATGMAAQAAMTAANSFLTNTFGPQTASAFFTTSASGVVGPSPAMAGVGTAMMVVFYAYLAYIVFNLLVSIVFACTDEEFELANKVQLLSTHYIGTYCKVKAIGCIEKRKSYCQFDSPLSRIMMEEIYKQPQMGLDWGTAKSPNCTGLKLTDISKVDWQQVNIDEWIGILIQTGNYVESDYSNINIETLTGAGSHLDKLTGTVGTADERDNILETSEEKLSEIDIDEKNREEYEETWSELQRTSNP